MVVNGQSLWHRKQIRTPAFDQNSGMALEDVYCRPRYRTQVQHIGIGPGTTCPMKDKDIAMRESTPTPATDPSTSPSGNTGQPCTTWYPTTGSGAGLGWAPEDTDATVLRSHPAAQTMYRFLSSSLPLFFDCRSDGGRTPPCETISAHEDGDDVGKAVDCHASDSSFITP